MISKAFFLLASSCLLSSAQIIAPVHDVITSYHSQNELGEYAYGYSGGPSAKHEVKTADGITQGGYSYIDAYGLPQHVNYVSDPVGGFRAAGTNFPLPVPAFVPHPAAPGVAVPIAEAVAPPDTIEVAAAKSHHFAEKAAATTAALLSRRRRSAEPFGRKRRSIYPYGALPLAHAYAAAPFATPYAAGLPLAHAYAAPVAAYAAPPVVPAPVAPTATQFHSQNELGEYKYGYANQDSAKEEVKTADGITRGSYSYRDAWGIPQSVSYISDPYNGFRAAGTNIPTAPIY